MVMFELEKFLHYLKAHLRNSKVFAYIGQLDKFVYIKQQYIVVNLQQISLAYCEKFVDKNPNQYFDSFIRFCYPAMGMVYKKASYEFIFSYQNTQVMRYVDLDSYRKELVKNLGYHFENYEFYLADQHITFNVKVNRADQAIKRFEQKVNDFVINFNRRNTDLIPVASYFIEKGDYDTQKQIFTINFCAIP